MSNLTRRSVPALLACLSVSGSTTLRAGAAPDPVLVAIEAAERANADQVRAGKEYSRLQEAHRSVAFYNPRVLVGHYTSMKGPDCGTVYPLYANCEAQIRGWTHGPDRETVIADLVAKLESDRTRNLGEQKALGIIGAEKASESAMQRLFEAEADVMNAEPTTRAGAIALASFAAHFMDEHRDEPNIVAVLRTLATFLSRSA